MWGRQSYRWSPMDFEANAKDGVAVDWPIRYDELAPWYDHVERFIGVSGQAEGLAQLPDGKFLPPMELNCVEKHLQAVDRGEVRAHAHDRPRRASDRAARAQPAARHLPVPQPVHSRLSVRRLLQQQLEHAARGRSDRQHDAAAEFDRVRADLRRAASDARAACACWTRRPTSTWSSRAKVIFLCASTFGSTFIMLNSVSKPLPERLRQRQRRARLQHHGSSPRRRRRRAASKASTSHYYTGRRPNGFYIPRFAISARTSATTCAASATRAARAGSAGRA